MPLGSLRPILRSGACSPRRPSCSTGGGRPCCHAWHPRHRLGVSPFPAQQSRAKVHTKCAMRRAHSIWMCCCGSELEGPDFWDGVRTRKFDNPCEPNGWLKEVALVVQPAIAEERPRYLLAALAADVPVIAAPACGLASQDLLTMVPANDLTALIAVLRASLP